MRRFFSWLEFWVFVLASAGAFWVFLFATLVFPDVLTRYQVCCTLALVPTCACAAFIQFLIIKDEERRYGW
jgi:hypothetical protein